MRQGDLVRVHSEHLDVPLYPGNDLSSQPFLAQAGDLVILLNDFPLDIGYVRVLHPVAGFCLAAKYRLRAL
jgi:hypothetical protein